MSIFGLFFLACGGKLSDTSSMETSDTSSPDTGGEISEPSMSAGDCTPLSEEECTESDICAPIMAAPITYDEENTCWTREEVIFTQCMSIDIACGEAEIYARPDPDASCMVFSNTCIPLEWDICDALNLPECID